MSHTPNPNLIFLESRGAGSGSGAPDVPPPDIDIETKTRLDLEARFTKAVAKVVTAYDWNDHQQILIANVIDEINMDDQAGAEVESLIASLQYDALGAGLKQGNSQLWKRWLIDKSITEMVRERNSDDHFDKEKVRLRLANVMAEIATQHY